MAPRHASSPPFPPPRPHAERVRGRVSYCDAAVDDEEGQWGLFITGLKSTQFLIGIYRTVMFACGARPPLPSQQRICPTRRPHPQSSSPVRQSALLWPRDWMQRLPNLHVLHVRVCAPAVAGMHACAISHTCETRAPGVGTPVLLYLAQYSWLQLLTWLAALAIPHSLPLDEQRSRQRAERLQRQLQERWACEATAAAAAAAQREAEAIDQRDGESGSLPLVTPPARMVRWGSLSAHDLRRASVRAVEAMADDEADGIDDSPGQEAGSAGSASISRERTHRQRRRPLRSDETTAAPPSATPPRATWHEHILGIADPLSPAELVVVEKLRAFSWEGARVQLRLWLSTGLTFGAKHRHAEAGEAGEAGGTASASPPTKQSSDHQGGDHQGIDNLLFYLMYYDLSAFVGCLAIYTLLVLWEGLVNSVPCLGCVLTGRGWQAENAFTLVIQVRHSPHSPSDLTALAIPLPDLATISHVPLA